MVFAYLPKTIVELCGIAYKYVSRCNEAKFNISVARNFRFSDRVTWSTVLFGISRTYFDNNPITTTFFGSRWPCYVDCIRPAIPRRRSWQIAHNYSTFLVHFTSITATQNLNFIYPEKWYYRALLETIVFLRFSYLSIEKLYAKGFIIFYLTSRFYYCCCS